MCTCTHLDTSRIIDGNSSSAQCSGYVVVGQSRLEQSYLIFFLHFAGGPDLTFIRALSLFRSWQLIKLMWLGLSGTRSTLPDWQLPQFLLHWFNSTLDNPSGGLDGGNPHSVFPKRFQFACVEPVLLPFRSTFPIPIRCANRFARRCLPWNLPSCQARCLSW